MNAKRAKTNPAGWVLLAGLLGVLAGWMPEAEAAQRIALVIGNGGYADKPLTHPKRDADDMAALLRGLGFEVTEATDVALSDLRQRVRAFIDAGRGAELRLFYYSGHGANYQNQSYLLPVGHDIQRVYELPEQGYPVQALLRGLREEAPKGVNLVLLDACRDEPFGQSKSIGDEYKGLGRVAASAGTLVAYATGAGQKAMGLYGDHNSQFTKYLLRYLKEPMEIRQALTLVRRAVYQENPNGQLPENSDSLIDPLYLVGIAPDRVASTGTGAVVPSPFRPTPPPAPAAGQAFQDTLSDGTPGPKMVVIPAGEFWMGSPESEKDRESNERRHRVKIEKAFALGQHEVTVGEFKRFAEATSYRTDAERNVVGKGCLTMDKGGKTGWQVGASWRKPGYEQDDAHPVACVSWNDAMAYAEWLAKETGQAYRLPTEAEWEYAARAGTTSARYWGDDPNQACRYANALDQTVLYTNIFDLPGPKDRSGMIHDCVDGHDYPAPVGSFQPNGWNLYDMLGNVLEWTCSSYDKDYGGAETQCADKDISGLPAVRGGCWAFISAGVRSAARGGLEPAGRNHSQGFRLARSL